KLFRSIRDFKGKSSFYTYLYRMALNTAIDYARKKKPPGQHAENSWPNRKNARGCAAWKTRN
ncbi:MAG TPA: sigma factor, partial [Thiobacillus sp.]